MVVLEVFVRSSFYMNIEAFHFIETKGLLLAVYYLHNIENIYKRMHMLV